MVSLSRPRFAHTPMIAPSTSPGLSAAGTQAAQLCAIRSARSSSSCTSAPITAPGTIPKADNAEYRPPIDSRPWAMSRNPFSSASCSSFDPGSVMAMKRFGACSPPTASFTRSKKYCSKILGSSVVPDLLETMKSVLARSISLSRAFTCAGSVESRIRSCGWPSAFPNVSDSTSGQRLEPPIPSSSACSKPASLTSAQGGRGARSGRAGPRRSRATRASRTRRRPSRASGPATTGGVPLRRTPNRRSCGPRRLSSREAGLPAELPCAYAASRRLARRAQRRAFRTPS